jgi:hypothetical protein
MNWIPCSERLPSVCENVLVFNGSDIYTAYLSKYSMRWMCRCNCDDGSYVDSVTHWMLLPLPPEVI